MPLLHFLALSTGLCRVLPVVLAFNLLLDSFHLLSLPVPLVRSELGFASEEFLIWLSVAASQSVPQRCELTVVVVEVQMMHGMASSAVDDG